jgi:hypothetical protein
VTIVDKYTATEMAFKHGYEKGYDAGKPKWIPVTERLPEKWQETNEALSGEYCDTPLAKRADVLVVGRFVKDLQCENAMYGSSNQRIIRRGG